MTRLLLALVGCLVLTSSALAALSSPQSDPSPFGSRLTLQLRHSAAAEAAQKEQLVITGETQVMLDGQPCKYADIPDNATIMLLEIAADRKTVLKVHFESGKTR
jgi:hypothetical protein